MKQNRQFYLVKIGLLLVAGLTGCEPDPDETIPATTGIVSLVSVLPTGTDRAEVLVKHSPALTQADWQLSVQTDAGASVSLSAAQPAQVAGTLAVIYQATGLAAGRTYRFALRYRTGQQSVALERTYQHPATASPWKRLAFLPVEEGNFTGQLYSPSAEYVYLPNRFVRPGEADSWGYFRTGNTWEPSRLKLAASPRQGMIFFQLDYADEPQYSKPALFYGLGYVSDDRLPEKRAYLNDFNEGGNPIPYDFPGEPGEVVVFTAANQGYLLTQNSTGVMYSYVVNTDSTNHWRRRAAFPEKTASLATFSLNDVGYVLNQRAGQPPRLFAYSPKIGTWTRKADFPGPNRTQGLAFTAKGKAFYGLGTASDIGLRDLWQYDPATDRWQHVTDYPGQGNIALVSMGYSDRAYFGLGYETQPTGQGTFRYVGCTDFWEFVP